MKNIILFGGAFDPIHFGHLNMVEAASSQLNAEVIFIPAKISVWKNDSCPVEDKINMINLALKETGLDKIATVSRYEVDLDRDSNYSIDTVRHFKSIYPNDNLFMLIGLDQVDNFHKWKEAKELSKLVRIVFFGRLNEQFNSNNVAEYNMLEISGEINDYNSTDIRSLKSLDTPDSVINYIIDNDLYFMQKIKSRMSLDRYEHSKSVGKLAYEIAKCNNVPDPKKALVAGLIHDCGKELPREVEKEIMEKHFKEYLYLPRIIYHQFTGAYIAKNEFGIDDEVILDAIKYHTTANSNMSDIAKIIYCTDKIEPTRGFNSKSLINSMKCSLTKGFDDVMTSNIEYYNKHGIDYRNPLTVACLDQYYKK